jgi:predicted HicB family RNase H-like nuclease
LFNGHYRKPKLGLDKLKKCVIIGVSTMAKTRPKRVHDSTLNIRANKKLLEEAKSKAREKGMSLSEYLRWAMRDLIKDG